MRVRGIPRDQRLDAECVAESEDGADIVVLGYAVQHACNRSVLLGKKVVTVGLLRRNAIAPLFASGAVVECNLTRVNGTTSNAFIERG